MSTDENQPAQQPYGPPMGDPYAYPPQGPAFQQGHYPPGYPAPPWGPPPQRPRQQDAEPGRFTWWDLGASVLYVGGFLTGLVALIGLLPPVADLLTSDDPDQVQQGLFGVNALSYGLLAAVAIFCSATALWRSIQRFGFLWWLKLLLVPVAWVVTIILNLLFVVFLLGADPETSANQEAIESMLAAVPFWAAVLVIGLLGPYVEEYFFRHLLVGKLSRYINVWICGAISIAAFPLLHFIPALIGLSDDLSLVTVVPYFTMGLLITVGYIVSGRNLFYAWLLHAFNNVMALAMAYLVQPWLEDMVGDFEELEAGMRLLSDIARILT